MTRAWMWTSLLVAGACAVGEPLEDVGETTSALTNTQGSEYQGSEYQGSEYQGSEYQGSEYQGSEYQGADYDGTTLAEVTLSNAQGLIVWKKLPDMTWEQRFPAKLCRWNASRSYLLAPCTIVDLATTPSPLAGITLTSKFTKVVNYIKVTITGRVRIGTDPDDLTAVARDTSTAMHRLEGTPAMSCSAIESCASNPLGCRKNCDLFTYKLYLLSADEKESYSFCPRGETAYAFSGRWSGGGYFSSSTTRFTMACRSGTIAKCARWGYRPWGTAKRNDDVAVPTAEYHQACVRAASADYCANGHSFTKNGTLVDIYDFGGASSGLEVGFIPATTTSPIVNNTFLFESTFDKFGGAWIDHVRYEEMSDRMNDLKYGCPGRWWDDGAGDVGANYNRRPEYGEIQSIRVAVRNTTSCAHSELTVGKWLDRRCNPGCIDIVKSFRPHCTNPHDARGWDQGCVDLAVSKCKVGTSVAPMAIHSECKTGPALTKYDSACALQVCMSNPACCNATSIAGWNSTCTNVANTVCRNGGENRLLGFCAVIRSSPLPPVNEI